MTTSPGTKAAVRSSLYELLSLAFLYPQRGTASFLATRSRELEAAASELGWHEVRAALQGLVSKMESSGDDTLLAQYIEVFGHSISNDCPPYEGEYDQAHIFQKAQTLASLNTFYQAFEVKLSPELKDRHDHISVELEFMHLLTLKEAHARLQDHGEDKVSLCRRAQKAFLAQHLATWIKGFARRLMGKTHQSSIYHLLALLLESYMSAEFEVFQIRPGLAPVAVAAPVSEDDRECEVSPLSFGTSREGL